MPEEAKTYARIDAIVQAPIIRPSNVAGMLLAGRYWYTDAPGMEQVEVDVTYEEGDVVVRFPPLGEDVGFEVLLADMAAASDWRQHFERIACGASGKRCGLEQHQAT